MIFNIIKRTGWITVPVLAGLACSMLVSPPDDYPPEEDLTAPGRIGNVQARLTIVPRYGRMVPAVRVGWDAAPENDVLYYTVEREYEQREDWEVVGALLKPLAVFTDNTIRFPEGETAVSPYRYRVCAFDSAGNKSVASEPDTVSLIAVPVLYRPQGTVSTARPLFDWESRFNTGKNFRIGIGRNADTLLLAEYSPPNFDDFRLNKTYTALKGISLVPAADSLAAGTYYWWVEVRLLPEEAGVPSRVGVEVQTFKVE